MFKWNSMLSTQEALGSTISTRTKQNQELPLPKLSSPYSGYLCRITLTFHNKLLDGLRYLWKSLMFLWHSLGCYSFSCLIIVLEGMHMP